MEYSYRDEDTLRELYIDQGMTQEEVADKLNTSPSTISRWIKKHGIETGNRGWTSESAENIAELYDPNKSFSEMASGTEYSPGQIRYAAIKDGKHETQDRSERRYTSEEIIEQIQCVEENRETVTRRVFELHDETASITAVTNHFGSWINALEEAGVDVSDHQINGLRSYTRSEIADEFEEYVSQTNTVSRQGFLESEYGPLSAIKPHYESFSELIETTDIPAEKIPTQYTTKEHIQAELSDVDGPIMLKDLVEKISVSKPKLYDLFGTKENIFEECNVEYKEPGYSMEEIEKMLEKTADSGTITPENISEADISPTAIINNSTEDRLANAIESFGFNYESTAKQYTDEELIQELRRCYEKHGDVKVGILKRDDGLPSWFTYVYRFGSWSEAKEIAGIDTDKRGRSIENRQDTYVYTPKFLEMREEVRARAGHECQSCGKHRNELDRNLDVHHITPVAEYDDIENAHTFDNLVAVCHDCHMAIEADNMDCPEPPEPE